jgi:hypothetical protein
MTGSSELSTWLFVELVPEIVARQARFDISVRAVLV